MIEKNKDVEGYSRIITIVVLLTLVTVHMVNFYQQLRIGGYIKLELGSIVLPIGSFIALTFDILLIIKNKSRSFNKVDVVLGLSAVSLLLSFILAEKKDFAFSGAYIHSEGVMVFFSYLIILFSISLIGAKKNYKLIYIVMTALGIFEVILSVMQVVIQPFFLQESLNDLYFENFRAYGTLENPNPFGSVMAIYLGYESVVYITSENKSKNIIHLLLASAYAYALFLSGTRGAILGFAVSFIGWFIILVLISSRRKEKIEVQIKKTVLVLLCLAVILGLFYLTAQDTFDNITGRVISDATINNVETIGSSRITVWKSTWELYRSSNIIFGTGISNIIEMINMGDFVLFNYDAHNRYLHLLCTQGLVGLGLYLALNIIIVFDIIRRNLKGNSNHLPEICGLLVGYFAYIIADVFCIGVYALQPFLYLILGIFAAQNRCNKFESSHESAETFDELNIDNKHGEKHE